MYTAERQEMSPQPDYISQKIFEYISFVRGRRRLDELVSTDPEASRELREWKHEATTDSLTRLPTKAFFFRYLLPGLRQKGINKCRVIRLDLANLKDFNRDDVWGDAGGDATAAATGVILGRLAEEFNAIPIRFHGDTFMLVFEKPPESLKKLVERGIEYFRQVDKDALIEGQVLGQPLLDYSEPEPRHLKLPAESYQRLVTIAGDEYAKILLPLKGTFHVFWLEIDKDSDYFDAAFQKADAICSLKKQKLVEYWRENYPQGFRHLLRKK